MSHHFPDVILIAITDGSKGRSCRLPFEAFVHEGKHKFRANLKHWWKFVYCTDQMKVWFGDYSCEWKTQELSFWSELCCLCHMSSHFAPKISRSHLPRSVACSLNKSQFHPFLNSIRDNAIRDLFMPCHKLFSNKNNYRMSESHWWLPEIIINSQNCNHHFHRQGV